MEATVDEIRNSDDRVADHDNCSDDRDNRVDEHHDQADDHDDGQADDHDERVDDHGIKDHDDHNARTDVLDDDIDERGDQADPRDDTVNDTDIDKSSKKKIASTDGPLSQTSSNVVTHQPKSSKKIPSVKQPQSQNISSKTVAINDIDVDVESGGIDLETELAFEPGSCLSASAAVGSASKDLCDGFTNLECRYPNVGCELSCGCDDGLELVSECTMELCSANCILGCLAFSLGLALDTKAVWNQDGVEFEVLGTGIETSQGTVIRLLGSGLGIIDEEKRETMMEKRKVKEARKAREKAAKEKEEMMKKATELELSGKDNPAVDLEEENASSSQE